MQPCLLPVSIFLNVRECLFHSLKIKPNCPLCKHPTIKRAVNSSKEISELFELYREMVAAYKLDTGNDLPLEKTLPVITGSPIKHLSQMFPYPEKEANSPVTKNDWQNPFAHPNSLSSSSHRNTLQEETIEETTDEEIEISNRTPRTQVRLFLINQDILRLQEARERLSKQIAAIDEQIATSSFEDFNVPSPPRNVIEDSLPHNLIIPSSPIIEDSQIVHPDFERLKKRAFKLIGSHLTADEWSTTEVAVDRFGGCLVKKYDDRVTHLVVRSSKSKIKRFSCWKM